MIEIVNEMPDKLKCEFVGEIVGTQCNWLTGDFYIEQKPGCRCQE